jgi:flagellar biosynthesis anti-sigma factor FlgM
MDIRTSGEGLKSLLGGNASTQPAVAPRSNAAAPASTALSSDRATLSSAGNEVQLTAGDDSVRMDKVTGVQAALAAGTYNVPPMAVASKMVDAMLSGD